MPAVDLAPRRNMAQESHKSYYGIRTFHLHRVNATPRMIKGMLPGFGVMKQSDSLFMIIPRQWLYHFPAGGSGTNNVEQAVSIGETRFPGNQLPLS